jgi:hypothetical protein
MGVYHSHQLAFVGAVQQEGTSGLRWGQAFPDWFQTIPPERVGMNGEYDYFGLQKRVEVAFRQQFSAVELACLTVTQRGRVVILQGHVASREMLDQLVDIASQVDGTIRVETSWVTYDVPGPLMFAV